jgi:hypothetical protein
MTSFLRSAGQGPRLICKMSGANVYKPYINPTYCALRPKNSKYIQYFKVYTAILYIFLVRLLVALAHFISGEENERNDDGNASSCNCRCMSATHSGITILARL